MVSGSYSVENQGEGSVENQGKESREKARPLPRIKIIIIIIATFYF